MTGAGHACGKVILLGEHAVVYGVPALAVGIDRGARARARALGPGPQPAARARVEHRRPRGPARSRPGARLPRAARGRPRALAVARRARGRGRGRPAAGRGARVLGGHRRRHRARARARTPGDDAVQERAMAWERVFHGNPSGVDAAVAARGGCVLFRKGEPLEPVRVRGPLQLCVGNTGIASSTKAMVEAVARLRARRPEVVDRVVRGGARRSCRTRGSPSRRAIGPRSGRLMDLQPDAPRRSLRVDARDRAHVRPGPRRRRARRQAHRRGRRRMRRRARALAGRRRRRARRVEGRGPRGLRHVAPRRRSRPARVESEAAP